MGKGSFVPIILNMMDTLIALPILHLFGIDEVISSIFLCWHLWLSQPHPAKRQSFIRIQRTEVLSTMPDKRPPLSALAAYHATYSLFQPYVIQQRLKFLD